MRTRLIFLQVTNFSHAQPVLSETIKKLFWREYLGFFKLAKIKKMFISLNDVVCFICIAALIFDSSQFRYWRIG